MSAEWQKADIVKSARNITLIIDTGVLVQDAAQTAIISNLVPYTSACTRNPVLTYWSDRFRRPQPFHADAVISMDEVFNRTIDSLDALVSQF